MMSSASTHRNLCMGFRKHETIEAMQRGIRKSTESYSLNTILCCSLACQFSMSKLICHVYSCTHHILCASIRKEKLLQVSVPYGFGPQTPSAHLHRPPH